MKTSKKKFETKTTEYYDDEHESLISPSYLFMIIIFQIFDNHIAQHILATQQDAIKL